MANIKFLIFLLATIVCGIGGDLDNPYTYRKYRSWVRCRMPPPIFRSPPRVSLLSVSAPTLHHSSPSPSFPVCAIVCFTCVRSSKCSTFQPCNMVQNLVTITSEYEARASTSSILPLGPIPTQSKARGIL